MDALAFTDVAQWRLFFLLPVEIKTYYNQLKLVEKLDDKLNPVIYC
jgi:hypothetical protein